MTDEKNTTEVHVEGNAEVTGDVTGTVEYEADASITLDTPAGSSGPKAVDVLPDGTTRVWMVDPGQPVMSPEDPAAAAQSSAGATNPSSKSESSSSARRSVNRAGGVD